MLRIWNIALTLTLTSSILVTHLRLNANKPTVLLWQGGRSAFHKGTGFHGNKERLSISHSPERRRKLAQFLSFFSHSAFLNWVNFRCLVSLKLIRGLQSIGLMTVHYLYKQPTLNLFATLWWVFNSIAVSLTIIPITRSFSQLSQ